MLVGGDVVVVVLVSVGGVVVVEVLVSAGRVVLVVGSVGSAAETGTDPNRNDITTRARPRMRLARLSGQIRRPDVASLCIADPSARRDPH